MQAKKNRYTNLTMNHRKKVQVVVVTSSKKALLLQTNKRRGSFWQNITGGVNGNEEFIEAAKRELKEETKFSQDNLVSLKEIEFTYEFMDQYGYNVEERCFLAIFHDSWDVEFDPNEHRNYKWICSEELKNQDIKFPSNFECLTYGFSTIASY